MSESAVTQPAQDEPEDQKRRIVVEARVREVVSESEQPWAFKISSDFLGALENKVRSLIEGAVARCDANHRRTLKAQDL